MTNDTTPNILLGKEVLYHSHYDPTLLFPIKRKDKRAELGIANEPPFYGEDIWNHYEVSWLNKKGKPVVAFAEISYNCRSEYIIESKSMKLYFNSLNNTQFNNVAEVEKIIQTDIEKKISAPVSVRIFPLKEFNKEKILIGFDALCLDEIDINCSAYLVDSSYLTTNDELVSESVYSNLLKSNCLVTNQPDWGSVQIAYKGNKINHQGLLRYIVSFRNHNEFHEQCIERIFMDLTRCCQPEELTVYGRYTRRGGLDINPFRTTNKNYEKINNNRLCRQ